jgi:endogenous inhibitor of DNA gyrase (YacG/DUF329 family)
MIHPIHIHKFCKRCNKSFKVKWKRRQFTHFCTKECKRLYYKELLASFNAGNIHLRMRKLVKGDKNGKGHKTK